MRQHQWLLRITSHGSRPFCAGIVIADGYVLDAAPILKWCIGLGQEKLLAWAAKNKFEVEWIDMDITEIRLGCAHTLNLGNYESTRIEAGLTISVKEGDSIADLRASAQTVLRNMLEETFRAQRRQKKGAQAEPATAATTGK